MDSVNVILILDGDTQYVLTLPTSEECGQEEWWGREKQDQDLQFGKRGDFFELTQSDNADIKPMCCSLLSV